MKISPILFFFCFMSLMLGIAILKALEARETQIREQIHEQIQGNKLIDFGELPDGTYQPKYVHVVNENGKEFNVNFTGGKFPSSIAVKDVKEIVQEFLDENPDIIAPTAETK